VGARNPRRPRITVAEQESLPLFEAAMRHETDGEVPPIEVEERPAAISTGLVTLDRLLDGGFPVGGITLIAARPKVGAASLIIGASLAALKRGERVAYFSERLRAEQLRGRFVVLESKVNGHRFQAGFVSAEDRIALAQARQNIPWSNLTLMSKREVFATQIDAHIFSYRPWLVVADVRPKISEPGARGGFPSLVEGVNQLAAIARRQHVAIVVRAVLPPRDGPPLRRELPGLGTIANRYTDVLLLHREPAGPAGDRVEVTLIRASGEDISPRHARLRFDQRFAGVLDP
jgi:hypothetical protein